MAKILVSYWRSDEISAGATLNFWDGLFKALQECGNDVLVINNSFYGIWTSNTTDNPLIESYLMSEVKKFDPDLIIAFNNRILQKIVDWFDGPVVLYDGDELKFFSDLDTIHKNIDRYKLFSIVDGWRSDYLDFGFRDDQIFYMPPGTKVTKDPSVEQKMNISFLGQRRYYLNNRVRDSIIQGKDLDILYNSYLDHLKTKNYDYTKLVRKNGALLSDSTYSDADLWPMFDDSYLVFASVLDLGLHLGGHEGRWREIADFIPQIAATHSTGRVFTLEENEYFYNSSKISLNINHPQGRGNGFSWRCWDVMASNACLVSSDSSELKRLTEKHVKIPVFTSPAEAREICKDLLDHPEKREEIVRLSQDFIDKNCRWEMRFKEMEELLGIKLIQKEHKGTIKKLKPITAELASTVNSWNGIDPSKHAKVVSVKREKGLKNTIKSIGKQMKKLLDLILWIYLKLYECVTEPKFIISYLILVSLLCFEKIICRNYFNLEIVSVNLLPAVVYSGIILLVLVLLYRPVRKVDFTIRRLLSTLHQYLKH